jgi:phosphatidate cytidylyltransferase
LNNFLKRTISGILFIIAIVGALLAGPLTFYILFTLITLFCQLEFYDLAEKNGANIQKITGITAGFVLFTLNFLIAGDYLDKWGYMGLFPFILLILIRETFRKKRNPFTNIAYTLSALIYPVLFMAVTSQLVFDIRMNTGYNHQILLYIMILIWSNDTLAYTVGKKFGKHSLLKSISPKKTWEGLFGGLLFSFLAAIVIFYTTQQMRLSIWILLALIVTIAGNFGDLTESYLKRSAGVKESGKIIPGHGGLLDRFDSALFIFPLAYICLKLLA